MNNLFISFQIWNLLAGVFRLTEKTADLFCPDFKQTYLSGLLPPIGSELIHLNA